MTSLNPPHPLCFARALGEPLVAAELRREPADFRVIEDLGFEPCGDGEHIYLYVTKTGANTPWVAEQIARFAGVRSFDVSYAGKKDRHAVTEQWFSCWLPGKAMPAWSNLAAEGVRILRAQRHNKKLRRGMHLGNRFEVRLRQVRPVAASLDQSSVVAELENRAKCLSEKGFPNYFGEQRFGHGGANLKYADDLMEGRRVPRAKRDIYLSAARSYLFNLALSDRVAEGSWLDEGEDGQQPEGWLPWISRRGDVVSDNPERFPTWHAGLARLGVKAMRRPLVVRPDMLNCEHRSDGDVVLSFGLPAGSFATSFLRELVMYSFPNESGEAARG